MKNLAHKLLLISFFLLGAILSYAQNVITGIIVDSISGEALIGAKVLVKQTKFFTFTDVEGVYSIDAQVGDTLIVTNLGSYDKEIVISDSKNVNIILSSKIMNEIIIPIVCGPGLVVINKTIPKVNINEKDFNKGVISDPAMLIQGKVAGLSIYNRGGNPNTEAIMRLRGISTMGSHIEPLIVIDGIVGASISNVDPNDIEAIEILKDGSASAMYGIRGTSGVIEIRTKKAARFLPAFSYQGQLGSSISTGGIKVMTPEEFITAGGINLGSKTDWVKEITRTGFANNHHLVAQIDKKVKARISANVRSVDGVLKSTGFDQFNLRGNMNSNLLKNKIKIDLNGSWTNRKSGLGFEDAFRYALTQNPTAPVYGKDAVPFFNAEQFGGFYETLGLFGSYNPVSILAQNKLTGKQKTLNYGGRIEYNNLKNFSLSLIYGHQNIANDRRALYPKTSIYRGGADNPLRKGLAELVDEESKFNLVETIAEHTRNFRNSKLVMTAGYAYQQSKSYNASIIFSDFNDVNFEDIELINAGNKKTLVKNSPNEVIQSVYAKTRFFMARQALFIDASIRRDGSTRLGINNKWGLFPAMSAGIDLNNFFNFYNVNSLIFRSGYGITGTLPQNDGLSQELKRITINQDGSVSTIVERQGNPDLKWEEKGEINLGLDLNARRLSASLDLYHRNIKDFVTPSFQDGSFKYINASNIRTKGAELTINYEMINRKSIVYNCGLVISSSKSILLDNYKDGFVGDLGGLGGIGANPIMLKKGEEIGNFYGPIFEKVGQDGRPVFIDINGDGVISTAKEYSENTDLAILGNGNPDVELGWTNQLKIGDWDINGFFRAAFGHSLLNGTRLFFENDSPFQTGLNYVNTSKKVKGIKYPVFSSLFVERADFFKLDYFTVTRTLNFKKCKNVKISLTGQNMFVLTNYTGGDPEPMLVDYGPKDNYGIAASTYNSVLSPGLDQLNNYFTSRTVVLGINLGF